MSDLRNWRHASTKSIITLAGCIVAAATILIYFLPRESKFGYTYETDKPWRYEQLIASYDFPIAKSEVEMQRERDSVARTFEPYYITDSLAGEEQVAALQADFSAGRFKGLPAYYLPRLVELLRKVYAQGVINAPERSRLQAAGKKNIRRIKGKMSVAEPVKDLFTRREAYTYIMDRDAGSVSRNVLQNCRIDNYIVPNLHADEQKNKQELESLMAQIIANSGMVQSGQLIIDRGQIVTPHHTRILDSLKKESERRMDPSRGYWMILAGQAVYVFVCISLLLTYLKLFRRDYLDSPHCLLLLFSLLTAFPVVTYLMMAHHFYSVYLVPYAIVPIFVRIFMDSRTAFVAHVVMALLSAVTLHNPFEFVLLQLVTGLAAIYSLRELTERSQLLRTVLAVVCAGLLVSFTYDLSQGLGSQAFDQSRTVYVVIGGILLLFAYPLMYLVERVFGFTSSVTLVELTNRQNRRETADGENGSALPRHRKDAQPGFLHGEPDGSEPTRPALGRAQRANHHQPRDRRSAAGRQASPAFGYQGLHTHPSRRGAGKVLLHTVCQQASGRRGGQAALQLSRPQSAHPRTGNTHDVRCGGSRLTQPEGIYGREPQRTGEPHYRLPAG